MTLIAECVPCRYGDHLHHTDWPKLPVRGMIGSGQECPCRGECVDRARAYTLPEVAAIQRAFGEDHIVRGEN